MMAEHVYSDDAKEQLGRWPAQARSLLDELLDDAASDLQRELLDRAVGAGHTPGEVHAFADELRGMGDDDIFDACTVQEETAKDYTVAQLLRAEGDPLYAFELNGGVIDPPEDGVSGPAPTPPERDDDDGDDDGRLPAPEPVFAPHKKKQATFVGDSAGARPKVTAKQLNAWAAPSPPTPQAAPSAPSGRVVTGSRDAIRRPGTRLMEEAVNDATRALNVSWRESEVDVAGGMKLEDAVAAAGQALARGIPIPLALGPAPGKSLRLVMVLQINTSGRNRAWQLYDPFSNELVWANEGDLLARAELPFANKVHRRITSIALPTARGATF